MQYRFVDFLIDRELIDSAAVGRILKHSPFTREPLGMIAAEHSLLLPEEVNLVLDQQRSGNERRFGEVALELDLLRAEQIEELLKIQEFRVAAHVAETLALGEVLSAREVFLALAIFLETRLAKDQQSFTVQQGT